MKDLTADMWSRQGAKIRATANDIKRNAEALAAELGEEKKTIDDVFAGFAPSEVFDRVIRRMVEIYPVSRLDLEVKRDDTDDGLVNWPPQRALASKRVFDREDSKGRLTPYYEYRDVAMSTVGPYRPEWIKFLRVVASDDPEDPDVAYNNGHLLHQMAIAVGPVNFYWKVGNRAHLAKMSTGGSNYIPPFVRHTYTSRDASREAYIVAVTFPGKLEHIQEELAVLDPDHVESQMLDLSDRQLACGGILRRELAISMLGLEQLSEGAEIAGARLETLLSGEEFPTMQELARIASRLGINVRDLLPPENIDGSQVVVKHSSFGNSRHFPSEECPSYRVEDLAGSRIVPFAKPMAVRILDTVAESEEPFLDLVAPAHEFAYNYGSEAALLHWQGGAGVRDAVIQPGGSYYLKPGVPHALRNFDPSRQSDIVIVRVGTSFHGDAHFELSNIPHEALHRVFSETRQWYDPRPEEA
jgi:uncharacterized RmlC-like cupin family protein